MQDPPLLLHRLAQPRPERELRERVGRGVGEDDVAARPPVLALIHGCVGVLEEILAVRRVARVEADADARRDVQLGLTDHEGLAHDLGDARGHALGDLERVGAVDRVPVKVGEEQEELVAALPRDEIGLPSCRSQPLRRLAQQLVAGTVPQAVVDELEAVEVEEQHADRLPVPLRARERDLQELLEHRAVRQAGQRVVVREERDLLLCLLLLGDVDEEPAPVHRLPVRVVDQVGLVSDPDHAPGARVEAVLGAIGRAVGDRLLVQPEGPLAVVGMQGSDPQTLVRVPLFLGVAEDVLDLGADVVGRDQIVDAVHVGDRRDLLD